MIGSIKCNCFGNDSVGEIFNTSVHLFCIYSEFTEVTGNRRMYWKQGCDNLVECNERVKLRFEICIPT